MFKKIRKALAKKAVSAAKGKLTYASIAGLLLPVVSVWLGFDVVPEDLRPFYDSFFAATALWGKFRASRGYV